MSLVAARLALQKGIFMDFHAMAELCGLLKTALVQALPASQTKQLAQIISKMTVDEFSTLTTESNQRSENLLQAVLSKEDVTLIEPQLLSCVFASFVPLASDRSALFDYYLVVARLCEAERVYTSLAVESDISNPVGFCIDRILAASNLSQDVCSPDLIEWPFEGEAPVPCLA